MIEARIAAKHWHPDEQSEWTLSIDHSSFDFVRFHRKKLDFIHIKKLDSELCNAHEIDEQTCIEIGLAVNNGLKTLSGQHDFQEGLGKI